MDCTGVASHLVAYHLATLDDAERDAVAAHLLECRACLATYLALKHAAERRSTESIERPSPAARMRLRAEVARTFTRPATADARPPVRLLARRIPLYQGFVAAAVAAAITLVLPDLVGRLSAHRVHEGTPEIDTSRARAASLHIY